MTENTSKTDSNQKILKELMYDDGQPLYKEEEDQKELLKESKIKKNCIKNGNHKDIKVF